MASPSAGEEATTLNGQTVTPLGQTSIEPSQLTDYLPAMAPKWFDIGLKLGCKDKAMELRESNEPLQRKCFVVIDEWMNNGESACWEYLCREVLRSEGVGLGHVADQIEKKLGLESSRQLSSQVDGSVETKNCTYQVEMQQLLVRLKEMETLSASKQQEIEELTAKCRTQEEGRKIAEKSRRELEGKLVISDRALRDVVCKRESLESEFEQYRLRMEGCVKEWTAKKQQLTAVNEDVATRLALLTQQRLKEVAESENEIEQLKTVNAILDKENEEYSEEVADMMRRMGEMKAELEAQRSVILLDERTRCSCDPKGPITRFMSSPSCISQEVLHPEVAAFEVMKVLQCSNVEAQNHLKTFFEVIDTSSHIATYTSGSPYRDWRCLAEHVGLHIANLLNTDCEKRLGVIFKEWSKKETVTVAKVRQVLTQRQCTRAADCLVFAAQCMVSHEEESMLVVTQVSQEDEGLLDLGEPGVSC